MQDSNVLLWGLIGIAAGVIIAIPLTYFLTRWMIKRWL